MGMKVGSLVEVAAFEPANNYLARVIRSEYADTFPAGYVAIKEVGSKLPEGLMVHESKLRAVGNC